MFFSEIRRTLFAATSKLRVETKATPLGMAAFSQFTEPSPEIRAAVRRYRLGLPAQARGKTNKAFHLPATYEAIPVHKRASPYGVLASSDAMIITRFRVSRADEEMSSLLGQKIEGRSVLELGLSGLELAWHCDMMRALEDRVAVWSVSSLIQPSGNHVLEHIVVPTHSGDGQLSLVGWFHCVGSSLEDYPAWTDVIDVRRERPGQRISDCLPEAGALDGPLMPEPQRKCQLDALV